MCRRLIAEAADSELLATSAEAWGFLDVVSEVQDDVDDVVEDAGTFNGNRLLSSISLFGRRRTLDEYRDYARHAELAAMSRGRSLETCYARTVWHMAAEAAHRLLADLQQFA